MPKLRVLALLAVTLPAMAQEIDGRVLEDTSGEPLVNAELRFHRAGMRELVADLVTERDGRFHTSGSIRGTLRGAANARDFAVVLLDAEAADSTAAQVAFVDEVRRFEFVALRPGQYRIAAQLAAGAAKARSVADVANMIEIDCNSLKLQLSAQSAAPRSAAVAESWKLIAGRSNGA
jgi:hypothetical protein